MGAPFRLLAAATALLAATSGCGLVGDGTREVTAVLPDSAGLFLGNDVGVLGVPVGTVTAIEPKGEVVEVTLEITDDDVRIPADAGAAVVARSVATDRYVELTPAYTDGPVMDDGATIPLERTVTPVDFDQVLASLERFSSGLTSDEASREGLRELVEVTARSLDGNGIRIARTVDDLAAAVDALSGQTGTVTGAVDSLDVLTANLAGNERTLRRFVRSVEGATDLLAAERLDIGTALITLRRAVRRVADFAEDNRALLRQDVRDLTAVLEDLLDSREDIDEVLDAFPLAMDNLDRALAAGDRLRVRLDPVALTPVSGPLGQVCGLLGDVCDDAVALPPDLAVIADLLSGGRS